MRTGCGILGKQLVDVDDAQSVSSPLTSDSEGDNQSDGGGMEPDGGDDDANEVIYVGEQDSVDLVSDVSEVEGGLSERSHKRKSGPDVTEDNMEVQRPEKSVSEEDYTGLTSDQVRLTTDPQDLVSWLLKTPLTNPTSSAAWAASPYPLGPTPTPVAAAAVAATATVAVAEPAGVQATPLHAVSERPIITPPKPDIVTVTKNLFSAAVKSAQDIEKTISDCDKHVQDMVSQLAVSHRFIQELKRDNKLLHDRAEKDKRTHQQLQTDFVAQSQKTKVLEAKLAEADNNLVKCRDDKDHFSTMYEEAILERDTAFEERDTAKSLLEDAIKLAMERDDGLHNMMIAKEKAEARAKEADEKVIRSDDGLPADSQLEKQLQKVNVITTTEQEIEVGEPNIRMLLTNERQLEPA